MNSGCSPEHLTFERFISKVFRCLPRRMSNYSKDPTLQEQWSSLCLKLFSILAQEGVPLLYCATMKQRRWTTKTPVWCHLAEWSCSISADLICCLFLQLQQRSWKVVYGNHFSKLLLFWLIRADTHWAYAHWNPRIHWNPVKFRKSLKSKHWWLFATSLNWVKRPGFLWKKLDSRLM